MNGIYLKFYVHENRRHHGILAYEWLLEQARAQGVAGGSAFRAIAGFGRHGVMHEEHFLELAGSQPVEVGFVMADEAQAQRFLEHLRGERLQLFYIMLPLSYGVTSNGSQGAGTPP